jgi:signal peptidase
VGADHSYVVTSGSMEPNISLGSVVIVKEVPTERIEVDDVITFQSGDAQQPTTHRVIEVTDREGERAFRTKGDANEDADAALVVPGQNARIEGQVMTVNGHLVAIPLVGYLLTFMKTQTGFVALVAVPFVLFIANEVWNVIASARVRRPDENDSAADAEVAEEAEVADAAQTETTDGTGTADEAASASAVVEEVDEEDSAGFTLRAIELRLSIVATGAFLAYSAWVAYVTVEFWAFAVAAGVGTGFVLLVGLYIAGRQGRSAGDDDETPADPGSSAESTDATTTDPAGAKSIETDREEQVSEREEVALPWNGSGEVDTEIGSEAGENPWPSMPSVDDAVVHDGSSGEAAGTRSEGADGEASDGTKTDQQPSMDDDVIHNNSGGGETGETGREAAENTEEQAGD